MTQKQMIVDRLKSNGAITRGEAEIDLGIKYKSFSSVLSALKREGMPIRTQRNRFNYMETTYVLDPNNSNASPRYSYTLNRRLWNIWRNMRERCDSPEHKSYQAYGGRGIKVCDEWEERFETFAEWAYASGYDDNAPFMECTLDRVDTDGNYEPSNCRWVSMKVQCNNRRNNHLLTHNGITKNITEWSELTKIPRDTIDRRLRQGWNVERALTTPVKKQKNNRAGIWSAPLVRKNA